MDVLFGSTDSLYPAETALAQTKQVRPSLRRISALRALFSTPFNLLFAFGDQLFSTSSKEGMETAAPGRETAMAEALAARAITVCRGSPFSRPVVK